MIRLVGPADASLYRIKIGRYKDRWYTDPLPTCPIAEASDWHGPSYTIVKGASGRDWTATGLGRAADDIQRHPAKYEGGRESIYARLTHANKHGLNVAAGRGTIIHWWFEDALAGKPFRQLTGTHFYDVPDESIVEANLYLPAVQQFFDTYQPELVVSEIVCIDRTLNGVGYGCTGDAGIRIEGDLLAADWKSRGPSSDHDIYPEEAGQVGGAFCKAEYAIVADDNGTSKRIHIPSFDGAIVVSVKPEGCRIYPIDIDKARTHFEAMHAWWVARQTEREPLGRPWAPKTAPDPVTKTVERRAALLERFNSMSEQEQDEYRALNIDRDDLDAIEAGLDQVDRFNHVTEPVAPQLRVVPPPPEPPDEGDPVDPDDVKLLHQRFDALPDLAKLWTGKLVAEGKRSFDWRIKEQPTTRRFELYRGVLALVEWGEGHDQLDEIVRGIVHLVTGNSGQVDPGYLLGCLEATEAKRFAEIAIDVTKDRYRLIGDDTTGTLRLTTVA